MVNEFIAHGLESSSANEKNSKGFPSFPRLATTGSSAPEPKPKP
ncbi:hypothetical protein [Corynebacterium ulcerans]|uniref:Uncharacterized protein n=1 Tax=Corynebacterium ulcerans FRC58 TaxID=1408268 RepID=A0ABM5U366_CORUL|nr:hypothetical protein [Corynebacterium ulcerans]AKN77932.1 Hypothetical protein CulFRC58_2078 [Corynebacterium ulcerans FRC58]